MFTYRTCNLQFSVFILPFGRPWKQCGSVLSGSNTIFKFSLAVNLLTCMLCKIWISCFLDNCLVEYMMWFILFDILSFISLTPFYFFSIYFLFSDSIPQSLSIEQHAFTATSHPAPHLLVFPFSYLPYLAPLNMSLTFETAVSEVQSIEQPGLTDQCCFVDRIQTCLVLCPPHPTPQNTAVQALHGSESSLVKKRQQLQPHSSSFSMKTVVLPVLIIKIHRLIPLHTHSFHLTRRRKSAK